MRNQGILYIIMLACLLAGCGEKETVLRFHAATYNGFRPEVQIGQASWQATMDSVQGNGEVSLPVDHPVLATVQFGKYDKRTVYIESGKELAIAYDCGKGTKKFTVSGDLEAENKFLEPGSKFYLPLASPLSKSSITETMQRADSILQVNRTRLAETEFSPAFKQLQEAQLELQLGEWLGRLFVLQDTAAYIQALSQHLPQGGQWMEMPGYCDFMKSAVRRLGLLEYKGKVEERDALAVKYTLEHIQEPNIRAYLLDLYIMPILTSGGVAGNEKYVEIYRQNITDSARLAKLEGVIKTFDKVAAGQPCPDFCLKDVNGKEVRLADLAGKYVYIDLWATWCGPCKGEMPSLAKLEEEFAGKDITFVSISIDRNKDIDLWKKTVADMKLGGVQLHLAENWDWLKNFMPTNLSVPRFILLDKEGKIINATMTRPSDKATKTTFEELLKN